MPIPLDFNIQGDVIPGKCVLVNFEGKLYPDRIMDKAGESYKIRAMAESGEYWKWPK